MLKSISTSIPPAEVSSPVLGAALCPSPIEWYNKNMKIQTVIKKFEGSDIFFRCPVCRASLSLHENGSFLCKNGHCFDLSSKGYVHLLPGGAGHDLRYDSELFTSRKTVFGDGFFEPVAMAVQETVTRFLPDKTPVVLDAGCGEGYYSHFLARSPGLHVYGIDNVKEAVVLAAKEPGHARFAVADLAALPVADGAVGILLNILAPANYDEFARVLCPDGAIIKAVPGKQYLRELRQCVSKNLESKTYTNEKTIGHMARHADIADQKTILYTLPVSQEQLVSFYKMTPLTSHIPIQEAQLEHITEITIHFELLIAYPRKR
ncbi:MAG: methyltransferase domain-containing protein [Christensenella sp.]|uniref:putative RNA methyltransferase n=1 Tax=Christensenella sp. TaxID=1935934 RepID=UPI002B213E2E|nr:methyltransferase domain-containing protein [Christensenella sp.]MEA5003516.1 methyltransferase domain-containing protein [Christensenella sp.]